MLNTKGQKLPEAQNIQLGGRNEKNYILSKMSVFVKSAYRGKCRMIAELRVNCQ